MTDKPEDAEQDESTSMPRLYEIYPDARSIFGKSEGLDALQDRAVFVLDTNVLLLPYGISKNSMAEIAATYERLAADQRLVIPGHVAREFADHRPAKLLAVIDRLADPPKGLLNLTELKPCPLLDGLTEYSDVLAAREKLSEAISAFSAEHQATVDEYRKAITSLRSLVSEWSWSDPVTNAYGKAFGDDQVLDLSVTEIRDVLNTLPRRYALRLPPGYKDGGKKTNPEGDLIIWNTILKIGRDRQCPLVLVTNERKGDWWHRNGNRPVYPRYELVNEYYRASGGQTFRIASFSDLLDLYGADESVLEEVRSQESLWTYSADGGMAPAWPSDLMEQFERQAELQGRVVAKTGQDAFPQDQVPVVEGKSSAWRRNVIRSARAVHAVRDHLRNAIGGAGSLIDAVTQMESVLAESGIHASHYDMPAALVVLREGRGDLRLVPVEVDVMTELKPLNLTDHTSRWHVTLQGTLCSVLQVVVLPEGEQPLTLGMMKVVGEIDARSRANGNGLLIGRLLENGSFEPMIRMRVDWLSR